MNIYDVYARCQPRFRARRRQLFLELFKPTNRTTILDVGGTLSEWIDFPVPATITVLNTAEAPPIQTWPAHISYCAGDGRALPFPDQRFDVVFSNSVIEHLRDFESQRQFAAEALRVGQGIYVQTPNRWFPIEPHFIAPGIHCLPRRFQLPLLRWCSVRGWFRRGDNVELKNLWDELRLLGLSEVEALFPNCRILRERFAGLTKSFIAIRLPASLATRAA